MKKILFNSTLMLLLFSAATFAQDTNTYVLTVISEDGVIKHYPLKSNDLVNVLKAATDNEICDDCPEDTEPPYHGDPDDSDYPGNGGDNDDDNPDDSRGSDTRHPDDPDDSGSRGGNGGGSDPDESGSGGNDIFI